MNGELERSIAVARDRAPANVEKAEDVGAEALNAAVGKIRAVSRRRSQLRTAVSASVALLVVAAGYGMWSRRTSVGVETAHVDAANSASANGSEVHFADGSIATPLLPDTTVEALSVSPRQVRVGLARGRARFDVVPMPSREFQVDVGDLHVVVLGTSFTITRGEHEMLVDVHHGHVRVDGNGTPRHLYGGQYASFQIDSSPSAENNVAIAEQPRQATNAPVARVQLPTDGRPAAARASESLGDILQAADAARSAGEPDEALALLTRGVQAHRDDPQLQAAMFTRARLLGDTLHRSREAAEAFAELRALSPNGSLTEDALAREIEAWSQLHDLAHVRERRAEYLRLYPDGVHRRAVERY